MYIAATNMYCACTHTYTHTNIYTQINYINACIHTYIQAWMHAHMQTHTLTNAQYSTYSSILWLPVLLEVDVLQAWSGGVGVVSETLQAGSIDSCWSEKEEEEVNKSSKRIEQFQRQTYYK